MNHLKFVVLLLLGFLLIGAAAGQNLLLDPSFEDGTPNSYWTEASTVYGTPLCDQTACGDGGGTALPRTGSWWAWFGGNSGGGETGSVTQSVVIPNGSSATLTFYLWIGDFDASGTDYLRVYVDGAQVFQTLETNAAYQDGYTLVTVDLSTYANGASHAIRFEGTDLSGSNTNISVDDVSLTVVTTPIPALQTYALVILLGILTTAGFAVIRNRLV